MLSQEQNELLTRTGPDTPMGVLLRRYWVPALLAEELPNPDCRPLSVKLLGEELVAFRDSNGRIGLLDLHCAHRGASLFFGRNEEHGLRCVYHGWKYDVQGHCVDMPNEPAFRGTETGGRDSRESSGLEAQAGSESSFADKIQLKSYPCEERGDVLWAYLGPPSLRPPLPDLEWALVPDAHRHVSKRLQECNYLQALEGGVDLAHLSFLHRNLDTRGDGRDQELTRADPSPRFEVADGDYGLMIAARRDAGPDQYYWRVSRWIMPWYTLFPPLIDEGMGGHAWVPIDDETCWAFSITWDRDRPLSGQTGTGQPSKEGVYLDLIPGSHRPTANRDNDYLIDRDVQHSKSFTGIPGIAAQDCAVQESMGPIYDRTQEHIGSSDVPISAVRRRLLEALAAIQAEDGPPGLNPVGHRVRPAAFLLPRTEPLAASV